MKIRKDTTRRPEKEILIIRFWRELRHLYRKYIPIRTINDSELTGKAPRGGLGVGVFSQT